MAKERKPILKTFTVQTGCCKKVFQLSLFRDVTIFPVCVTLVWSHIREAAYSRLVRNSQLFEACRPLKQKLESSWTTCNSHLPVHKNTNKVVIVKEDLLDFYYTYDFLREELSVAAFIAR